MKNKNFEKELPDGYENVFHIDASSKKTGVILNLIALALMLVLAALTIALPFAVRGEFKINPTLLIIILPFYLLYIILHELTHGAAYKLKTGEKLTFGLTLSVAFCGVPDIYVYRRPARFAAAAPLVLFSVIFGALAAVFFFVNITLYIVFAAVFSLHIGGCAGDMYLIALLTFKYKDDKALIRDTGPEQNIFIKSEVIL